MVVRPEPHPGTGSVPRAFADAVTAMRGARLRPEISVEEMPAPQRIAPHAVAMTADVEVDGEEVGTGRIILLHDPAGNDAWDGEFRCVTYVRADLDPELVTDPVLAEVAWTWLTDALASHGADHLAPSGTVTRVSSESFGSMDDEPGSAQVEIRASWTPVDPTRVADHVEAWGELLCTAAGLEPVPDGVTAMPTRRGQRGSGD